MPPLDLLSSRNNASLSDAAGSQAKIERPVVLLVPLQATRFACPSLTPAIRFSTRRTTDLCLVSSLAKLQILFHPS